jgi:hypothetical protein
LDKNIIENIKNRNSWTQEPKSRGRCQSLKHEFYITSIWLLLRQVIEGKIKGGIEVTGRRGRRRRKLLDDFKERRGYSFLREEALDRTVWIARFGRVVNE